MVLSGRVPSDLAPNRLAQAVGRLRAERREFIDLTESNPTRAGFHYPADLLAPLADPRGLRYAPDPLGVAEARDAVSADYARRGLAVAPDRIVLTASTSEAYSLLFKVLCEPGDEVLTPRPSYPLFDHLTRLDAVVARPYDLEYQGVWSIDMASVRRGFSPRTRALLVVSPNNPTGSFVKAEEFDAVATICATREAALIADEVFAEYELPAGAASAHGHALSSRDALTFSLGGMSKSIGLPQVKLGWIALAGPEPKVREAMAALEIACDAYLSVATPVQLAAADLLRRGANLRRQIQARLAVNYRRLVDRTAATPSCRALRVEGGWYAVLQVPSLGPEEDLVLELLTGEGVLVHPGYFFDFPREAFLIASLIVPEAAFVEGIDRVLRHFDCRVGHSGQEPAKS